MFTGIVQGIGEVKSIEDRSGLRRIAVSYPERGEGLILPRIGASIAVDGVCLTVTKIEGGNVVFDIMKETLLKTTLGELQVGSQVNIERSARLSDEVGGHYVGGHVSDTVEIIKIDQPENNHVITFKIAPEFIKYILPKGFVGINGCSLTIADVDQSNATFTVWLIPETLRVTTFGQKKVGDRVNLEIDSQTQTIVDTIENYLKNKV